MNKNNWLKSFLIGGAIGLFMWLFWIFLNNKTGLNVKNIFGEFFIEIFLGIFLLYGIIFIFSRKFRKKLIPDELAWQANSRAANLGLWVMIIMSFLVLILHHFGFWHDPDMSEAQIAVGLVSFPTLLISGISYAYFLKNPIDVNK